MVLTCINAPNIIFGIVNPLDPDSTNNQVILILKYYLYICRCLGDKPSINGGLKYLKYCIKKRQPYISYPLHKKNIYVKSGCFLKLSLMFEFSVQCCKMFFCLWKKCISMPYVFFLYLYLPLLFVKNKQITKI